MIHLLCKVSNLVHELNAGQIGGKLELLGEFPALHLPARQG
jgi:hypothetical protein